MNPVRCAIEYDTEDKGKYDLVSLVSLSLSLNLSLSLCVTIIIPECRMRGISIMVILDTSFASCNIHPSTFANSFATSRIHPDTVLDKER